MNLLVHLLKSSILLLIIVSCSTPRAAKVVSGVDSWFQLQRIINQSSNAKQSSGSIVMYQQLLSDVLGTSCSFFPNDSKSAQIVYKKCGPPHAVIGAVSRYFSEVDAPNTGYDRIILFNRTYFKDIKGLVCELY